VTDRQAAQALKFISALHDQVNEMTTKMAWLERKSARTSSASMVREARLEAAALRRDISEAQVLIDRLRSRYLKSHERPHRR
jgi:hypothetical protein